MFQFTHGGNPHNHGYETAALEVLCGDMLTVTNPKLRAQLDKKYRESERYRDAFLQGYESVMDRAGGITSRGMPCLIVSDSKWLKLNPAARDQLSIRMQQETRDRQ